MELFLRLFSLKRFTSRYTPLTTYATVSEGRAEMVDFRLARLHTGEPPSQMPQPVPTAPKELLKLVKDLSAAEGLEQLVSSTNTEKNFRYENYKERSDFLRGLTLNFPNIASLRRSLGFIVALYFFFFKFLFHSFTPPAFCLQSGPECGGPDRLGSGNL